MEKINSKKPNSRFYLEDQQHLKHSWTMLAIYLKKAVGSFRNDLLTQENHYCDWTFSIDV